MLKLLQLQEKPCFPIVLKEREREKCCYWELRERESVCVCERERERRDVLFGCWVV